MTRQTILVVDDEPDIRAILRRLLAGEGYDVCEAQNGQEALARVRECRPAAVLMDITMPHLSGLDVLRRLRHTPRLAQVPVVLMTGSPIIRPRPQPAQSGATFLMTKPLDLEHVLDTVARACALAERRQEPAASGMVRELHAFTAAELDDLPLFVVHCRG